MELGSQLGFFSIEETDGRIEFHSQGVDYQNLFDFFYFLEVIEDAKDSLESSDAELAQKLLTYAVKDA